MFWHPLRGKAKKYSKFKNSNNYFFFFNSMLTKHIFPLLKNISINTHFVPLDECFERF